MNKIESITPETKIGALLDHYPQLEEVLIEMAPAFKKLRNPILRNTVAKVATLRQVAQIGNVPLGKLINQLRSVVGQTADFETESGTREASVPPDWFNPSKIMKSLDARPIIEAGKQPMSQVLDELKGLKSGEICQLITPFIPAPLIDMAMKKDYQTWSQQVEKDVFHTFFHIPKV